MTRSERRTVRNKITVEESSGNIFADIGLYRSLSANGNPRLSTLYAVAKAVGLRLTLEAA